MNAGRFEFPDTTANEAECDLISFRRSEFKPELKKVATAGALLARFDALVADGFISYEPGPNDTYVIEFKEPFLAPNQANSEQT